MTTEEEILIEKMKSEIAELRTKEREYRLVQDRLLNLEQNFGRLNEDRRRMDEDYKSRVEGNIHFIQTLRGEVDEQRNLYNDRKKQNDSLIQEVEFLKQNIAERTTDINRIKHETHQANDKGEDLQLKKRHCDEELHDLRERNREDLCELDNLRAANDERTQDNINLQNQIRALESMLSKQLNSLEEINRATEQKRQDARNIEMHGDEAEKELAGMKNQLKNFLSELDHLKGLEKRYKDENMEL